MSNKQQTGNLVSPKSGSSARKSKLRAESALGDNKNIANSQKRKLVRDAVELSLSRKKTQLSEPDETQLSLRQPSVEPTQVDSDQEHTEEEQHLPNDDDNNDTSPCNSQDREVDDDESEHWEEENFTSNATEMDNEQEEGFSQVGSIVREPKFRTCPAARWGHAMCQIDAKKLLVYGGQAYVDGKLSTLSDVYLFDMSKGTWTKPVNCEGEPRQWHSTTFIPERKLIISFGGESLHPKNGRPITTEQVMVLDTEIMLWYPPTVSGTIPSGRSGHSATLMTASNDLVVFGGVKGTKFQNSVSVLDTARWKWSAPKIAGDAPRPRSYHTATAVPRSHGKSWLVIFGGNDRSVSFDSVHCLETDGKTWTWINPLTTGTIPTPRTGHTAILLADQKRILIHGGWDPNVDSADDNIFHDSYVLDTSSWTWTKASTPTFWELDGISDGGPRRVGHTSSLVDGDSGDQECVHLFGGRIPGDAFSNDFQTVML